MHRHSIAALTTALGILLAGCGTGASPQDPAVSAAKGAKLAFEHVCLPVVLDGQDFEKVATARGMTPMAPAVSGGNTARTFRLGLTGVTASVWQDGSCAVGVQSGDSDQLLAQTLASLQTRGHVMTLGVSGQPAANGGVAAAYCSAGPRPLLLGITRPASDTSRAHALIATLYPATDKPSAVCAPG